MCALKWYIKSLYRHIFLEDISKHARVIKKKHFLIPNRIYSQAPWPQRPKLGTNVAKGIICDVVVLFYFSGEPPLSYSVEKRRDPKNIAQFLGSRLFSTWGAAVKAPGCKSCWGLGSFFFLMTLACLDISSKKMCLYRLFIYHFKAHTISNKLV